MKHMDAATDSGSSSPNADRRRRSAAGFSLVEILVAVLVLAIGLLGLAGLQVASLKANESSRMRTDVTIAAYDLADRLRADTASFFQDGQDSSGLLTLGHGACCGDASGETEEEGGGGCTYADSAWGRWTAHFCGLNFPSPGSGNFAEVNCQDANSCGAGNCAISIFWDDQRGEHIGGTGAAVVKEFRFCIRLPTSRS